jgi:hypothetical protein
MAENKGARKPWPVVGSVRKGEDGTSYIKLADGVELLLNGEKVPLNDKRTLRLENPRTKVTMLKDKGFISEADADKRLERLSEMTWLKYDIIASPPRT